VPLLTAMLVPTPRLIPTGWHGRGCLRWRCEGAGCEGRGGGGARGGKGERGWRGGEGLEGSAAPEVLESGDWVTALRRAAEIREGMASRAAAMGHAWDSAVPGDTRAQCGRASRVAYQTAR